MLGSTVPRQGNYVAFVLNVFLRSVNGTLLFRYWYAPETTAPDTAFLWIPSIPWAKFSWLTAGYPAGFLSSYRIMNEVLVKKLSLKREDAREAALLWHLLWKSYLWKISCWLCAVLIYKFSIADRNVQIMFMNWKNLEWFVNKLWTRI